MPHRAAVPRPIEPSAAADEARTRAERRAKSAEIRGRIEANRAKRLAIGDAMKAEAGVRVHEVWPEENGGLAYLSDDLIQSPAGRNMRQLYIVAHECGHIFLHRAGSEGYALPSHVKEMEAESYAVQAFVAHGMKPPRELVAHGRRYVGWWVEKDRSAGVPIDPRGVAYADGRRSPMEPLRAVPDAWRTGRHRTSLHLPPQPWSVGMSAWLASAVAAWLPTSLKDWWRRRRRVPPRAEPPDVRRRRALDALLLARMEDMWWPPLTYGPPGWLVWMWFWARVALFAPLAIYAVWQIKADLLPPDVARLGAMLATMAILWTVVLARERLEADRNRQRRRWLARGSGPTAGRCPLRAWATGLPPAAG